MEKKAKVMAALVAGAIAIAGAQGAARCSSQHGGGQEAPGQGQQQEEQRQEGEREEPQRQQEQQEEEQQAPADPVGAIEGTTWESEDGARTLRVLPGLFVESGGEDGDRLLYWSAPQDVRSAEGGFTARLTVSEEDGGEGAAATLGVVEGNGRARLDCSALAGPYYMDTGDAPAVSLSGDASRIEEALGCPADEVAGAIGEWARLRAPKARTATWSGEVYADYGAGTRMTSFTLDDADATAVSVTVGPDGEPVAS